VSGGPRALAPVCAIVLLGGLLCAAVAQLPASTAPPPPGARLSTSVSVHERHVTNTVAGVNFDLRALDTLGEELILFVAAVGAALLLRARRAERATERADETAGRRRTDIPGPVRALGAALVAPGLVFGAYVVAHGHLTPGGGFQGGAIVASALLLVFVAGQVIPGGIRGSLAVVELADAVGAVGFALVALGGLVFSGAALANFIALGVSGQLLSGGTILVLEVTVGMEVAGAVTLVLAELLDQSLLREA
jgi:multicomponent Na+:H+ antiporter subunit B